MKIDWKKAGFGLLILFFSEIYCPLYGQGNVDVQKGTISYVTSQKVYVKFENTRNILPGDTLFIMKDEGLIPFLIVENKSSISCVTIPLLNTNPKISDAVYASKRDKVREEGRQDEDATESGQLPSEGVSSKDTPETRVRDYHNAALKQKLNGRISASSYNTFSKERELHRMQYTFSLKANHLADSKFSVENYMIFRHTLNEWDVVSENLNDALKIYSFSIKYDLDRNSSISIGRRINPRISSMGTIDGLQAEKGFGEFLIGGIVGFRPDYEDYGFNSNLLQYGGYIGHASAPGNKFQQSTLAFIEQKNGSMTDRRFLYLQHSNSLLKDLHFYGSAEISLYENLRDTARTIFDLSNLYVSLRYRLSKSLSFTASYDNRNNVLFYETYKNYIDQLIDEETRQGVRFNVSVKPFKKVSFGASTGWRFQKSDMNLSKNLSTWVTFYRLTEMNLMVTLNSNFLNTNTVQSRIFGGRVSGDLMNGKLNAGLQYRSVFYSYQSLEEATKQEIAGASLQLKMSRQLSFSLYYEGIFDRENERYTLLNGKLIMRF